MFWSSGDVDGLVKYYDKWIKGHPEDVDAMMRLARVLSIQQRMPEAAEWFRRAIEKAPSQSEPRLALVESLATADRYGDAAAEMEALVELQPDNPDYIVRWGELVFNDDKRSEPQRREEAKAIWLKMLAKRSDDPVSVARVADLLRGSGSAEAALEQYRAAVELAPKEPQYREYLGEYLHQLGRKDEALQAWRELASGDRRTRDNLVRLSEVYGAFQYPEQALAVMAEACGMDPTFGHRARYAELLREGSKFDEALAQLDQAEELADDPELRELVIEERIKNYQASGTLADRIDQAEAAVQGDKAHDAASWRLLALLRDANRKFQLACEAAAKATELESGNPLLWETAATIQERAGRFGDAVKSYRKLATLDRRFLSNYLTQIASIEMRLGNVDAALSAGEELIASAPGNAEHYRYFADLCFRVGQADRGFDVLRRSVLSNPNDQEAIVYLARMLSEEFRTDEAIELYWRAFDLAKDVDDKVAVVEPLTELYLRTNRFDALIDRLELVSRERNKPRDGVLLTAAAHQAAGDLGMARQLLEQLAREESRDTKLLEQLVKLSRLEYDFERAAEYQKRLAAAAPTPENEYQLASLLLELGDLDQAEALWIKLSQRKRDGTALSNAISTLLQKEQFETAAKLIEREMSADASDWEVLGPAMIVYARLDRSEDALRIARRVDELKVDPGKPTTKVKQDMARRASRRNQSVNQYDPYAQLGLPSRLMQLSQQIKQALAPGSSDRYSGSRNQAFTPTCFQDVQAIARGIPLVADDEDFDESAFVEQFVEEAVESSDVGDLWWAVFYVMWQDPRVQYSQEPNEDYEKCLDALVGQNDPYAAAQRISTMINQRRRHSSGQGSDPDPLSEEELDQAKQWSAMAATANRRTANYYDLYLAAEFSRGGREAEAEEIIDQYVESAKASSNAELAMLQAASVMMNEQFVKDLSPSLFKKSRDMLTGALSGLKLTGAASSRGYGQQFGNLVSQHVQRDQLDEALLTVDEVLQWQAKQTAAMRPSQREGRSRNAGPLNYGRVVGGRYVRVSIAFPPPSGYFGADAIYTVHGLYDACQENPEKLAQAKSQLQDWADAEVDDPYLQFARQIAHAAFAYWTDDKKTTAAALERAGQLQLGDQFVSLARARLLFDSGKFREALEVVESLRPSNQRMLVDRELTILQLLLQLGDLDRAKQSAQKLFALRLRSETELKLAELMFQLGMKDLGDRMMGRIRRRAGGNQGTLVQLMNRYAASGDNKAAAEMARQVIRRTTPRGTRNYYNSENQQHEQAVRVLAQVKQLEPLIKQYEQLVERSPKSTKLVDKLAAFYEAA
ncbi:MAG: tetratricopeptide repeat protein, partial [Planctomycetota bacterium]